MSASGGRRIKRSLHIDLSSIRFLSEEGIDRFKHFKLLERYIEANQELAEYNDSIGGSANVDLRRLTNVGTFRAYVFNYLKHHPRIHDGMTLLVRQLQPSPQGLPLELYAFTNDTAWSRRTRTSNRISSITSWRASARSASGCIRSRAARISPRSAPLEAS